MLKGLFLKELSSLCTFPMCFKSKLKGKQHPTPLLVIALLQTVGPEAKGFPLCLFSNCFSFPKRAKATWSQPEGTVRPAWAAASNSSDTFLHTWDVWWPCHVLSLPRDGWVTAEQSQESGDMWTQRNVPTVELAPRKSKSLSLSPPFFLPPFPSSLPPSSLPFPSSFLPLPSQFQHLIKPVHTHYFTCPS